MKQYRISPRANFIDYDGGAFFITINTKDFKHYFGEITDGRMNLSVIGEFLCKQLDSCRDFVDNIEIPIYVVMPNHIHAIIVVKGDFTRKNILQNRQRNPNSALRCNPDDERHIPSLTKYISSLKGSVTKYAKSTGIKFSWHTRYYDRMLRNDDEWNRASQYIEDNVAKWESRHNSPLEQWHP